MPLERQIDLHFPKLGLDLASPRNRWPRVMIDEKPEYFTHNGVNVRSYAGASGRYRGGSRPALSKLLPDQVAGTRWVVQELSSLVTTLRSLTLGLVAYYDCDGDLRDSYSRNQHLTESATTFGTGLIGSEVTDGAGNRKPLTGLSQAGLTISAWLYAETAAGRGGGVGFGEGAEVGDALRIAYRSDGANGKVVVRNRTGTDLIESGFEYTLDTRLHAVLTWNGQTIRLTVNNVSVGTAAYTIPTDWTQLTFGIKTVGETLTSAVDEVAIYNRAITASEINLLYNGGSGRRPFATTGGTVQLSQSGRLVSLLAVSQGVVKVMNPGDESWTATTNNSGEEPPLNFTGVMDSTPHLQKMYYADGINYVYYDPVTNSVELWEADTAGTIPSGADGNVGRLLATWRDRVLIAGIYDEPHNIFASAVGDAHDFDYSPVDPSPTQAWALNLADQGQVGDVITGLCPWSDDVLVVFCDHSVYLIRGDITAGGEIDEVSDKIGCAFGRAWCKAPDGTVYWVSNRSGIWSMVPGNPPQRVSTKIDNLLMDLDMGRNIFRMAYDDRRQEIRLFITWVDNPQETTHFTLELRPQAWWKDTFADDDMNPLCVCEFDGNDPGDRVILLGCWDGYVRKVDHHAETDDGVPIESEVLLGPLLTSNTDEVKLTSLQGVFGLGSGEVNYDILVGRTAEEALSATAVSPGVFQEARGYNEFVNRSGHALYVRLSSTKKWAMEMIRAGMSSVLSPVRRRRNG